MRITARQGHQDAGNPRAQPRGAASHRGASPGRAAPRRPRLKDAARIAGCGLLLVALAFAHSRARAQEFEFHPPVSAADPATPAIMRDLAVRILPVYQEDDTERYLENLSALQLTSGDYAAAYASQQSLRERRQNAYPDRLGGQEVVSDIYVRARAIEAQDKVSFAQAFTQSFQDVLLLLNNPDAYALFKRLRTPLSVLQLDLQRAFDERRAKGTITLPEAVELIRTYLTFDAYRNFGPLINGFDVEDDHRRYMTAEDVPIATAGGSSISAVLVRPRSAVKPLPTLLQLTLDPAEQNYAKECAAHGYVGVVAYIRRTANGSGGIVPYQDDGDAARAVIDWIAKQPWSDGRVGMYGSSYSAFVQWAAAKRLPPALRAIATSAATAPGITAPLAGNIFRNSAYRFSYCSTHTEAADEKSCSDDAQWRALDATWYASGKSYRDFGRVHGGHNPIFQRWLNHPSYDRFWQKLVPFREEFSHIDIPVLSTAGYYADGEIGSLYYFNQHYQYDARANQTLLIGPYDDGVMQHGALANLQGYQLDPAALIDLRELRFQWFDSVLKGGAKPDLLKSAVNYEVMGANEWRHAASIEGMANGSLRFYLDAASEGESHLLARHEAAAATFLKQTVDLKDRSDANWTAPAALLSRDLKTQNAVIFLSEPLSHPIDVAGLFAARLDFTTNKMDMDLNIALYELLPSGGYLALFAPNYEIRASYARDRVHRHLLKAGERQQLTVRSERLTSRRLQAGSRLVMVLGINKRPDREINYGTGADVSEESIADGKIPVKIRWYGSSYIDIPIRK
jgi:putative CocE/NonD family hydrolase